MIRVFGDSHAGRLAFALGGVPDGLHIEGSNGGLLVVMKVSRQGRGLRLTADAVDWIPALDVTIEPGEPVVFSGPFHSSPVSRHAAWTTHCPWFIADAHPDLVPVSDAVLATVVARRMAQSYAFFDLARELGIDVTVLESPFLPRRVLAETGIREDVLAAVDRAFRGAVRRGLAARGIAVIDVPAETRDGALLRAGYEMPEPDPHHGNEAYGALTIRSILDHFGVDARARAS